MANIYFCSIKSFIQVERSLRPRKRGKSKQHLAGLLSFNGNAKKRGGKNTLNVLERESFNRKLELLDFGHNKYCARLIIFSGCRCGYVLLNLFLVKYTDGVLKKGHYATLSTHLKCIMFHQHCKKDNKQERSGGWTDDGGMSGSTGDEKKGRKCDMRHAVSSIIISQPKRAKVSRY